MITFRYFHYWEKYPHLCIQYFLYVVPKGRLYAKAVDKHIENPSDQSGFL